MALTDAIAALAVRVAQECNSLAAALSDKYSLPAGGIPVVDLSATARAEGVMIWQTYGLQAVGIGQQDIPWVVPYDMTITAVRYWQKTAGSGGAAAVELRRGGTASGNTIAGSNSTPSTSPTFATLSVDVSAGDLIWIYQTAANTTPGAQLAAEIIGRRR